jgi:hypothetical protein
MKALNAHKDLIHIPSYKGSSPFAVWELHSTSFGLAKAKSVPCRFYGGPPMKYTTFTGTLLTMLIDRILTAHYNGNLDVVNKFLLPQQLPDGLSMGWIG